jgi:hypothetical protein
MVYVPVKPSHTGTHTRTHSYLLVRDNVTADGRVDARGHEVLEDDGHALL